MDLVLDGTDNFEPHFLINEACFKLNISWIYGGSADGQWHDYEYNPGNHSLSALYGVDLPSPGSYPTCASSGVLNMITGVIGNMESSEAVKILVGSPKVSKSRFEIDLWNNTTRHLELKKSPQCSHLRTG